MELLHIFDDAKKALAELKREMDFKRKNKKRAAAVELLDALARCRGKLEISRTSFERSIREQSAFIQEGLREGHDTMIQENSLYDAALGYLLVREAVFALKSINNYDSVEHAYELLNEAVKIMSGKAKPKNSLNLGKQHERNVYGFITTNASLRAKAEMVDNFYDELMRTGDIESCIDHYKDERSARESQGEDSADALPGRLSPGGKAQEDLGDDDSLFDLNVLRVSERRDDDGKL